MDFKQAREGAGLTLAQLSEVSGYAIGTISDLERKGVGGKRLKLKLVEILTGIKSELSTQREPESSRLVDDLITEIENLRRQMQVVERAAQRLNSQRGRKEADRLARKTVSDLAKPPKPTS
jgi:transcriptional regulator with XRE-family HTH domain